MDKLHIINKQITRYHWLKGDTSTENLEMRFFYNYFSLVKTLYSCIYFILFIIYFV